MSLIKTTLITAALALAVAGGASAQSYRENIHRGDGGDQYDIYTPPAPALARPHAIRPARRGLGTGLYMTTQPAVPADDPMLDRAKGSVRDD